jgi:hypothetical protein
VKDFFENVEAVELLAMLAVAGIGIYYIHDWFSKTNCILTPGAIPGVTGATQAQVKAAETASKNLSPGGSVVWTCADDQTNFDYVQPGGNVTQVRHTFFGQLFGNPVKYTTIPASCYVQPSGGIVNPAFGCCYSCYVGCAPTY